MPKRVKYRKSQRGRVRGEASRGNFVAFGEYGLQALEPAWLTARQIEAARVAATHFLHREGKLFMRIFPTKPVSAKPLETRMGKGKGETEYWAAVIKPGMVLYELGGVPEDVAKQAFNRAARKLPVRTRFVLRRHRV
ncbi:MAG TPA: 50S ribosomal protein L16 [Planctomycetota bacterium]|nr:50S ribosomal protein L16 [Planctomycetota bacterium]HRR81404.1 50S ribosomal protein L16 [Planctomycetota bacterium]HRT94757.1 50S ribosomal protein L16 [Planctomycetota bacterium]